MNEIFKWPPYQLLLRLDTTNLNPDCCLINSSTKNRTLFSPLYSFWCPMIEWIRIFARGHGFSWHTHMFSCVSAGCWHMIWCWHRPPWERKRDKERRSLTSHWTLSRTVGISIQGKIQKMVKLHIDSQRNYRELKKNRRARAVETFCFAGSGDTLLCCSCVFNFIVNQCCFLALLDRLEVFRCVPLGGAERICSVIGWDLCCMDSNMEAGECRQRQSSFHWLLWNSSSYLHLWWRFVIYHIFFCDSNCEQEGNKAFSQIMKVCVCLWISKYKNLNLLPGL